MPYEARGNKTTTYRLSLRVYKGTVGTVAPDDDHLLPCPQGAFAYPVSPPNDTGPASDTPHQFFYDQNNHQHLAL